MKRRKPKNDLVDKAPSTNGEETGLTEQPATPPAESPNGSSTAAEEARAPVAEEKETGLAEHQPMESEAPLPAPPVLADNSRAELEERIRRLEDALALMAEAKQQHTRVEAAKPSAPPASIPTAFVAPVAQIVPPSPPPAPITSLPGEAATSFLFNVGKHFLTAPSPPVAAVAQPQPPPQDSVFTLSMRWGMLFYEMYAECRTIVRLSVDPRYRLSWTSRLTPVVLFALLFVLPFLVPFSTVPALGTLLGILVDLPVAYLLFKVLSHEARRYRQTSPDLPASLRLPPDV